MNTPKQKVELAEKRLSMLIYKEQKAEAHIKDIRDRIDMEREYILYWQSQFEVSPST